MTLTLRNCQANFKKVINSYILIYTFFTNAAYSQMKSQLPVMTRSMTMKILDLVKCIFTYFILFIDTFLLQNHRCKLHSHPKTALLEMWIARMRISRRSTARINRKQVRQFSVLIYVFNSIFIAAAKPAQSQQHKSKKRTYPSVATSDEWFRIYQEEEAEKLAVEEAKKQRIQQRAEKKLQKENEKQQRA